MRISVSAPILSLSRLDKPGRPQSASFPVPARHPFKGLGPTGGLTETGVGLSRVGSILCLDTETRYLGEIRAGPTRRNPCRADCWTLSRRRQSSFVVIRRRSSFVDS